MAESESASESKQTASPTKVSGGVNIGGIKEAYGNINVGGDVIGRDKVLEPEGGAIAAGEGGVVIGGDIHGSIINIYSQTAQFADHSSAPLKGLGIWIQKLEECENGQPDRIVERVLGAGLSHIVLKIADGSKPYLSPKAAEIYRSVAVPLREKNVALWGVHSLRGQNPADEVSLAARLMADLQLAGYIAEAGAEFKKIPESTARDLFSKLHESLSDKPIGLSSFRYPSFQRDMPWPALLEQVAFVIPQVYWEQAHNPGAQLMRSVDEYSRLTPARPLFPVGSAYAVGNWKPTASDLAEFIQTARDLGLNGVSFSRWEWLGSPENRQLWAVLQQMPWQIDEAQPAQASAKTPDSSSSSTSEAELDSSVPAPTFERQFIQIIRNDEVEKVTDRLGYDNYADTFVRLVLDERTRPPLTIGISGAWGSGKSFILNRVQDKLEKAAADQLAASPKPKWYQVGKSHPKPRLHVVQFNAWDYNASDAVWPGLVRGILDKLDRFPNWFTLTADGHIRWIWLSSESTGVNQNGKCSRIQHGCRTALANSRPPQLNARDWQCPKSADPFNRVAGRDLDSGGLCHARESGIDHSPGLGWRLHHFQNGLGPACGPMDQRSV